MPFGTGPNDPWYYNNSLGIRIGPFTGSDQSNAAANQRASQLMGLPGLVVPPLANPAVPGSHTLQQTYGNPVAAALDSTVTQAVTPSADDNYRRALAARGPQPTIEQGQKQIIAAQNFPSDTGQVQAPQFLKDWGNDLMASMGVPGYEAPAYPSSSTSGTAQAAPAEKSPTATETPTVNIPGVGNITAPPTVYDVPSSNEAATHLAAASPGPVDDDLFDKLDKLLQRMGYPAAPDTSNPKQAAADAYAAHELDRTKLLAQLAFAGGLTASAGGPWEDVGKGFVAAGNVYDQGQQRYLKALQNSADRYSSDQKDKYAYQAKKAGVMADLYISDQNQKIKAQELARQQAKDERDYRLRSSNILYPKQGDNAVFDPNAEEKRRKEAYIYQRTGVPTFDMSD